MNRRALFIIIASVLAGKLVYLAVARLAESSQITSQSFRHRFVLDTNTAEQLRLSDVPANLHIAKPRSLPPTLTLHPMPLVKPVETKVAKKDDKEEEKKKEEERRKKRKKKLEEKTEQVAKTPTVVAPPQPVQLVPAPPPLAMPVWGAPATPNGANGGPNNSVNLTNAAPTTTTAAPIVGVLSNNNAIAGWIKLLTNNPTPALMDNFEQEYARHQINEAQFYQVLDAMETNSNAEARYLAVQGAAKYQNINSFKILADESKSETNATIQAAVTKALTSYDNVSSESILKGALNSGDPAEVAVAEQFLAQLTS